MATGTRIMSEIRVDNITDEAGTGGPKTPFITIEKNTFPTQDGLPLDLAEGSIAFVDEGPGSLYFKNNTQWRVLGNPLGTVANPATSAQQILDSGDSQGDGVYFIDLPGVGVQQVFCLMNPIFDGGGWMIVANHRGGVVMTDGHQPRLTANSSQVGTSRNDSSSPTNSFSVNCGNFNISEVIHFAYDNNTFTDSVAYYQQSFSPTIQLPSDSSTYKFDNTGGGNTLPGFGDRLRNDRGEFDHNEFRPAGIFLGTPGSGGSDTSSVYPVWVSYWVSSNESRTFSFTNVVSGGSTGWDDYQDGSGMGDQWSVENVGANAFRNFPSCVAIR